MRRASGLAAGTAHSAPPPISAASQQAAAHIRVHQSWQRPKCMPEGRHGHARLRPTELLVVVEDDGHRCGPLDRLIGARVPANGPPVGRADPYLEAGQAVPTGRLRPPQHAPVEVAPGRDARPSSLGTRRNTPWPASVPGRERPHISSAFPGAPRTCRRRIHPAPPPGQSLGLAPSPRRQSGAKPRSSAGSPPPPTSSRRADAEDGRRPFGVVPDLPRNALASTLRHKGLGPS